MAYLKQYLATIWADWVARMSSIVGLIFVVVALAVRLTEVAQARYWLVAATVCYAISSFRAWRTEKQGNDKLQKIIDSLNQVPESTSLTPKELVRVFEGRTTLQGKKLAEAYVGKWITMAGLVSDVTLTGPQVGVTFKGSPSVNAYFTAKEWGDPISVLQQGNSITIRGRVDRVSQYGVGLEDCELIRVNPQEDQLHLPETTA
jgi:hypothetical protein